MALNSFAPVRRKEGVLWDAAPDLYFKGFLLREKGNMVSSQTAVLRSTCGGMIKRSVISSRDVTRIVTDSFGRAAIQNLIALDAVKGSSSEARFVYKEELDIPPDDHLGVAFAREVERNRETAASAATIAAVIGIDTERWRFVQIQLSGDEPAGKFQGLAYELLYLAQPLLGSLPETPSHELPACGRSHIPDADPFRAGAGSQATAAGNYYLQRAKPSSTVVAASFLTDARSLEQHLPEDFVQGTLMLKYIPRTRDWGRGRNCVK
ncbi:DUF4865 family protein [Bradyrhizobium icense]|uniref:Uncharacterized protein n=1 Tax=Bradyrhizobium icense TaxID=1274631 RepID=A0A1B1UBJ4_9BRAD|nr:hypothetical protein LMTR13_08095 [Bradyrhizobium icense]